MSFSIKSVDVALAPSIAKAMVSARWAEPHWKALFESTTTPTQIVYDLSQRLPWNLINNRTTKRHQVAIDNATGQVVAYIRWILPTHLASTDPVVWPEAQVAEATPEDRAVYEQMFKAVSDDGKVQGMRMDLLEYLNTPLEEMDAKINEGGPFLCKLSLDYLTTATEYQRRGIGAMLLKAGLEVADAHGLRSYVTSSAAGAKLYQNHGYKTVETVTMDYSQFGGTEPVSDYFMIREPRQ
ncbi:unnamed protein product [Aureobasidium uvarum]|uniref:N-acetyltransferase domain-containing protein n=1 Tax=Aureobasidium uvarum TaxID=2773716 RepID=A0A9N8KB78_9PEZI|nr:unnamed protein product [Aureobasidium uvarum]